MKITQSEFSERPMEGMFVTPSGTIWFDSYLTGPEGARFTLYKTPEVSQSDIRTCKQKLRQDRDVQSFEVVTVVDD